MMLKDNGERTEFETGAVRSIQSDNGRCDLLPLKQICKLFEGGSKIDSLVVSVLSALNDYIYNGGTDKIYKAISEIASVCYDDTPTMILDLSMHFKECLKKYPERNWEKGLPTHSFIDSGVRHLMKIARGDQDEPHVRALIWNLLAVVWNDENKPQCVDLPFVNLFCVPNRYCPNVVEEAECSCQVEKHQG